MNPFPFDEYAYVKKHSEQLTLLRLLHDVRLDEQGVRDLVAALSYATGLTPPNLHIFKGKRTVTARSWGAEAGQSGRYNNIGRIIHISVPTSAHVLVHEFAHHAVHTRPRKDQPGRHTPHGAVFVDKLDWLARHAVKLINVAPVAAAAFKPVAATCTVTVRRDRGVGKPKNQTRFHWEPCGRPTPCPRHR